MSLIKKSLGSTKQIADVPEFAPYVLIGAGTASYYAALTIRARDPDAVVLILGDEDENAYSRTHLSKGLLCRLFKILFDFQNYGGTETRTLPKLCNTKACKAAPETSTLK